MPMRKCVSIAAAFVLLSGLALAQSPDVAPPQGEFVPWSFATGLRTNVTDHEVVADVQTIHLSDRSWLRVTFASVSLQPGDYIRVESPLTGVCLLYTSPSPRDLSTSRMPSSA